MTDTIKGRPMKVGTHLPTYIPIPNFLVDFNISQTAKLVYGMLLNRTTLSQKNNMVDEDGDVYVIYTIEHLARDLGRSEMTIKNAERELVEAGLLRKRRNGYRRANDLYVLLPETLLTDQKVSIRQKEKNPDKGKDSFRHTDRKHSPNYLRKTNDTTTNYNYSYAEGESF